MKRGKIKEEQKYIHIYLSLVADEVDFRLARLRGCLRREDDVWRFLGLLHEHVDQRLLLVRLRQRWQLRRGRRRRRGCLDEDDLVMLLRGLRLRQVLRRFVLRRFWRRHVHVHVLVDHRILLRRSITISGWSIAATGYSATATSAGGREV